MKNYLKIFSFAASLLVFAACGKSGAENALTTAGELADSIASAEADGTATVNAPDLQLSFTVEDAELPLDCIGQNVFDLFASQQLKRLSPQDITTVCNALRDSKGNLIVILNSPAGESATFTLTPKQILYLQRAKNSELNLGAARNEVVAIAQRMVPAPEAHSGALRVETSVSKSFLEYNVIWPKASAYDKYPQGLLTKNYFNALKKQYQALGRLAEPIVNELNTLGIDGVRIVYSAEDSDKELKQAFPWREIRLPIEEEK